jgi:hypothetical protein
MHLLAKSGHTVNEFFYVCSPFVDGIPRQAESLGCAVAVHGLFVHCPSSSFAIQSSGKLESLPYGGLPSAV